MKEKDRANWQSAAKAWTPRPPLAPGTADVAWYAARAAAQAHSGGPLRALLLGVTSSIATMDWPRATELTAVDWSMPMIDTVWPRAGSPAGARVVCADWFALPLRAESFDFIAGDGIYTPMGSLAALADLHCKLGRVLAGDGSCAIRTFSRGEDPPAVEQLFDELLSGRETDLGVFRFLLAMAMQGSDPDGVRISDAGRLWMQRVPEPAITGQAFGWRSGDIACLERWRTQDVQYIFPTVGELRAAAAPYFEIDAVDTPDMRWGRHFVRVALRHRG